MSGFSLGEIPTPVHRMDRLESFLGPGAPILLVKRDDLTPYGGCKFRKAMALVKEAVAQKASAVVTEGAIQSRHARATAIAARSYGLTCVLVLSREREGSPDEGTLLDDPIGARVVLTERAEQRPVAVAETCELLRLEGFRPAVVPFSGSMPATVLAYTDAFQEIVEQVGATGRTFDALVFASATGGIQAGLEIGKRLFSPQTKVYGVTPGIPAGEILAHVTDLAAAACRLRNLTVEINSCDVVVSDDYAGAGYLKPSLESEEAARLALELEGLQLDPTYTAKAFAFLLGQIARQSFQPNDTIVFLQTAG
ncbi:MAG TPA: pyridoxal-phosphate dependent enzyme [Actinomycetota bacterium]|nr:pyridoxal-phosphate dependent enzyme [Actinomycetota bacterium]